MTPIIRILLVSLATIAGLVGSPAPAPALGPAGSGAATVPELDWRSCPNPTQQGFECATAQVPLDYGDPHGATIELALIRHVATGPGRRIGSLFHEPGGPGIGGTRFLPVWYQSFPREVRERFDVVSWDPRGVGKSTAVRCFDSAEQAIAWLEHVPTGAPVSEQERQVWIRAYAELGQRCQEVMPTSCVTFPPPTPPAIWTSSARPWETSSSPSLEPPTGLLWVPFMPISSPAWSAQ